MVGGLVVLQGHVLSVAQDDLRVLERQLNSPAKLARRVVFAVQDRADLQADYGSVQIQGSIHIASLRQA